jgi:hypothetical protein
VLARFISPDSLIPNAYNILDHNRYAYVRHNPLKYTDPTGHWVESAIDIALIGYDVYDISQNGLNWENGVSLAANVAGLILPVATGLGVVTRAAGKVDDVAKAVTKADDVADIAKSDTLDDVAEGYTQKIYRAASGSDDSLTPRPGIDDGVDGGLSFWDSLDNIKSGEKYVTVDPQKFGDLRAIRDNNPPGHVSVRPQSNSDLKEWAATRGTGKPHRLTTEVKNAVIDIGKKAKME